MAINAVGLDQAVYGDYATSADVVADKTSLSNDDFMTLLLVELQYQDPTEPTDTEQILTQTSQLASLEATDKTNQALEDLAASLSASNDFSTISAIGKTADLGSNAISIDEGSSSTFEMFFPSDVTQGNVEITDVNGNIIKTIEVGTNPSGVYQFTWDGTDNTDAKVEGGIYYASASYTDANNVAQTTRVGTYPIESVRFDSGTTLLKLGSSYVPLENITEIY
ncbi:MULTISPECIES: FlgD immunoglobulin-like domain containing protein [Sulfurimonas]|uniref:FlgD immunoglobulin-like domain containing protein n=1 Tax=Sulfurimonas TaxID=202746 RepID=UPI001264222F|nr:FlgD immunoglobulin-like domain containing protein [Sulfurimonas indica]